VRELHKAGIELILDVVFNHTGEGNELGPTMCFRGIDNPTYYSLTGTPSDPFRYYINYTGCGNSVKFENSPVIRFTLDLSGIGSRRCMWTVSGSTSHLCSGGIRRFQDFVMLLRCDFSRPRSLPVEAYCRTVGSRHLSGRQLPGRLVRVEWQVQGHDSEIRKRRCRSVKRPGLEAHRFCRLVC